MLTVQEKGKHLTLADRVTIEHCLLFRWRLVDIAAKLGKDPTTISKEVRRNRLLTTTCVSVSCEHKHGCDVTNLCSSGCNRPCARCIERNCTRICGLYMPRQCIRHKKFPYVCNGCEKGICLYGHFRYSAKIADAKYRESLTSSREGIDISAREFQHLDQLISPLCKNGQSIYHIFINHQAEIGCSQRTIYNYFEKNLFSAKNIDLPRKVVYKKRKKVYKPSAPSTQKHAFERTYDDFLSFLEQTPETRVVEMDTVMGRREQGKAILTMFFRDSSFMLAFLMDSCTQECVRQIFESLYNRLGHDVFHDVFPVMLTDNGSEFKAPLDIETAPDGRQRTKVFYCHPMNSNQKSRLEKNHEYLRYIFPKGASLERYSQEDVTLAVNHINSTARASLNGSCPYQLARLLLDHSLFEKFGLFKIPADDVILKPLLLKK